MRVLVPPDRFGNAEFLVVVLLYPWTGIEPGDGGERLLNGLRQQPRMAPTNIDHISQQHEYFDFVSNNLWRSANSSPRQKRSCRKAAIRRQKSAGIAFGTSSFGCLTVSAWRMRGQERLVATGDVAPEKVPQDGFPTLLQVTIVSLPVISEALQRVDPFIRTPPI